jgi:hypothetical protein
MKTFDFIDTPSWNRGQSVETSFQDILDRRGIKHRRSTLEEQYKHFDYVTERGTIDVKARKRVNRSDSSEQDELVWLEFKNTAGDRGWLASDVDYIAFERQDDFVLIKRAYLYEMASKKCDLDDKVNRGSDALYKGYTRNGRSDLLSIVKMSDILNLPVQILEK